MEYFENGTSIPQITPGEEIEGTKPHRAQEKEKES